MDSVLKDDIASEFRKEYYLAAKSKEGRLWKAFHKFNATLEKALNKIYLDIPSAAVLTTVVLFATVPPAAVAALCFWAADAGTALFSNIACRTRAEDAIWKDIESGTLPERYNDVLDSRIKGLSEKLELYTTQKAQLPAKGAAAAAFATATSCETAAPAAVAPTPAVEAPKP